MSEDKKSKSFLERAKFRLHSIYLVYYLGIIGLVAILCSLIMMLDENWMLQWPPTGLDILLILCSTLLIILIWLFLYWIRLASPLTRLTRKEFGTVFDVDLQQFDMLKQGLDQRIHAIQDYVRQCYIVSDRPLTSMEENKLRDLWLIIYEFTYELDQIRDFYQDWYRFGFSRRRRRRRFRSFLLTFLIDIMLYEKSHRFASVMQLNQNAVKFLDAIEVKDRMESGSFSRFFFQLAGMESQVRIVAGRNWFRLVKRFAGKKSCQHPQCQTLIDQIEATLKQIDQTAPIDFRKLEMLPERRVLKRAIHRIWLPAQTSVAKWMGTHRAMKALGEFVITKNQFEEMDRHLEPGDIMLSRKNWYFSNVGLPGFWPHAILYIGDPEKFKRYFDDDNVKSYLKELTNEECKLEDYLHKTYPERWQRFLNGNGQEDFQVIEGMNPRIMFHSLQEACGDYVCAMRPRLLDKKTKAQAIIKAFGYLDTPYDFNFDFATDHALVCTELVWRSYRPCENKEGLHIELVEVAGRKTLPANEFARHFAKEHGKPDAQLDFVYFLDANEEKQIAVVSNEEAFLKTHERSKWSFMQD